MDVEELWIKLSAMPRFDKIAVEVDCDGWGVTYEVDKIVNVGGLVILTLEAPVVAKPEPDTEETFTVLQLREMFAQRCDDSITLGEALDVVEKGPT